MFVSVSKLQNLNKKSNTNRYSLYRNDIVNTLRNAFIINRYSFIEMIL